jgi:meiotically up-regulated gene 157 (Mug157) protein
MVHPNTLAAILPLLAASSFAQQVNYTCPNPAVYFTEYHGPFSGGRFNLSYQRPPKHCRTFNLSELEDTISSMREQISDPDLSRLFENAFPNTLDTAIRWHGIAANNSDEELTFIITGDINAMWLRDSSNQLQSYLALLKPNTSQNSLASLYRGVINLQSRYINTSPHCNSYQPPPESGVEPAVNSFAATDVVFPNITNTTVFECKYELDSLAAFLEVSYNYYNATEDLDFFNRFQWVDTVQTIMNTVLNLTTGTYDPDGRVLDQPYTWNRTANSATESVSNLFRGNPVMGGTGLIRSYFRPSDDSCIYQLFIPANMMFSHYLGLCADIMQNLQNPSAPTLSSSMRNLSSAIRAAIDDYGLYHFGNATIYAYEVDGYGSVNIMDDANIPSLLSAPFFGYDSNDSTYQTTRQLLLSPSNSYYMRGPVINAIGGPHVSFGHAWPMASIVRILTTSDDDEIRGELRQLVGSTDGLGLIHESVNSWNVSDWTRPWFSWANGLFGQMILDLQDRKPYLLSESYQ